MASLYTREKNPSSGTWHFKKLKEGRGIKTGDLRRICYARPFISGRPRWQRAECRDIHGYQTRSLPDKLQPKHWMSPWRAPNPIGS